MEDLPNFCHFQHAIGATARVQGSRSHAGQRLFSSSSGRAPSRGQDVSGIFRRGRGFPRFKGKGWYDSFTYPQLGFAVSGSQLSLSKIGNVKMKLHRPMAGEVKTLTLKHENGTWSACFSCRVDTEPLPENSDAVGIGIDVGLESFAVTSDAEIIGNPRWFRAAQRRCAASSAMHLVASNARQAGERPAC
jgi:transposase